MSFPVSPSHRISSHISYQLPTILRETTKVPQMHEFQTSFLDQALDSHALKFGSFTLKSGRQSPYFFNLGFFNTGRSLLALATSFAKSIIASGIQFDVLFGPAYKGIPLAAITVVKLSELDPKNYGHVGYSFNRKEMKDHGEGGTIVGSELHGVRVMIIDDVMTAGTAINEAFGIIERQKGTVVGCIIALDRQETTVNSEKSAAQAVSERYGVPVVSIVTLANIIEHMKEKLTTEQLAFIEKYRTQYSPSSMK